MIAAVICGTLGVGATQAIASGVSSSFTVSPASTQAGGNPNLTADLGFTYTGATDSVKTVTAQLAPGLVAAIANVPTTCSAAQLATSTCPAGSLIGTGQVTTTLTTVNAQLYLLPAPTPNDVAGLGAVLTGGPLGAVVLTGTGALDIADNAAGQPVGEISNLTVPLVPAVQVTAIHVMLNATTSNGKAFTRLPTSCSVATSSVAVTTYEGHAGANTSSFTPTGCAALAYHPTVAARVIKDAGDNGAEIITSTAQPNAATESATKALELDVPASLSPNTSADVSCLTGSPCTVGKATATSPLLPNADLSNAAVKLGGSPLAPTLTVAFPAPVPFSITGSINLVTNVVTFPDVPDVPLSSLVVDITGTKAGKAFITSCTPSSIGAKFTPQDGNATLTVSSPIAFQGCGSTPTVGKPTISGASLTGLASGHPKLHFVARHGANAPDIASLSVAASGGLRFRASKKCVGTRKKRHCTVAVRGLSVSGGLVKAVKVSGGRLLITLKVASARVSVTVKGPGLSESNSLKQKVRKHRVKKLSLTFKLTNAGGTRTTISLKLRV
jgi:hypothetical protein